MSVITKLMYNINSFLFTISTVSILFFVNDNFGFMFLLLINDSVFLSNDFPFKFIKWRMLSFLNCIEFLE